MVHLSDASAALAAVVGPGRPEHGAVLAVGEVVPVEQQHGVVPIALALLKDEGVVRARQRVCDRVPRAHVALRMLFEGEHSAASERNGSHGRVGALPLSLSPSLSLSLSLSLSNLWRRERGRRGAIGVCEAVLLAQVDQLSLPLLREEARVGIDHPDEAGDSEGPKWEKYREIEERKGSVTVCVQRGEAKEVDVDVAAVEEQARNHQRRQPQHCLVGHAQ
mmetsp:Transcript_12322/g.49401  ORF Transcript_12322/g.49401 Transcript_12322/m.49401 type:complete len:220 (-) Transcript_12322:89-748(-)